MRSKKFPNLFTEVKIGNITIPNRLAMAPMGVGNYGAFFEERLAEFYGARARGGIGLVLTETAYVSSFEEDPYPRFMPVPRFDDETKISRAHAIANRVKMYGGVPGLQLGAGLGRNSLDPMPDNPPMSASAIPTMQVPEILCREMTQEDIDRKLEQFARAARNALHCGFEVIEIHAHAGYLLEQFFCKATNHRTDKYGGSAENRFRFAKEILEAIKGEVGDKIAVTIRMSIDHMDGENGITLEEGLEYCKLAEAAGYDALHIDAGNYNSMDYVSPSPYLGKTPLVKFARAAKAVVNIPIITVGSFLMPQEAENAIANGDADMVAVGRAVLADPEWANKARQGREDEIRGCIQCAERCAEYCYVNKQATCSVNPFCGYETELSLMPTDEPKNVTIIGGGVTGMVTALTATRRGHNVTVLEKNAELGGHMNLISKEDVKLGVKNYNNYLKRQMEIKGIKVEYNCDVTIEKIKQTNPDVVVAATGSREFVPNIPGFDNEKVVTIKGLYDNVELKGNENIVVVGGGVNGCEVTFMLSEKGHKVTIIDMIDFEMFAHGLALGNMPTLFRNLTTNENVTVMANTKCKCIRDGVLICENAAGEEVEVNFDILVAAMGMKSVNEFAKQVEEEFPETYIIGDALKCAKIGDAVHQAFFTALRI